MNTSAPATVGLIELHHLANLLAQAGIRTVTGADYRAAAVAVRGALESAGPIPIFVADSPWPGLRAWTEKSARETPVVVLRTASGNGTQFAGLTGEVALPATVGAILAAAGLNAPEAIASIVVDADGNVGQASAPFAAVAPQTPVMEAPADPWSAQTPAPATPADPWAAQVTEAPFAAPEAVALPDSRPVSPVDPWSAQTPSFDQVAPVQPSVAPAYEAPAAPVQAPEVPAFDPAAFAPQAPVYEAPVAQPVAPAYEVPTAPVQAPEVPAFEAPVQPAQVAAPVDPWSAQAPSFDQVAPVAQPVAPAYEVPTAPVQAPEVPAFDPAAFAPQAPVYEAPVAQPVAPAYEVPTAPVQAVAPYAQPVAHVADPLTAPVTPPATGPLTPAQRQPGLAEVIIVWAGKGGVGKSTSTFSLAQRAAKAGLRVILIDANFGQGDMRTFLRIGNAGLPSVYQAAISGDLKQALIDPDTLNASRSPKLDPLGFAVVQAPPAHLTDPTIVTPEAYMAVVEQARQIADLVVIDTQIIESVDSTGMVDRFILPLLRAGAWGVGVTDLSSPGISNLLTRLKAFSAAGVNRSSQLTLMNRIPRGVGFNIEGVSSAFNEHSVFLGAVYADDSIPENMNRGRAVSNMPVIAPILDAALRQVTGRQEFSPNAAAEQEASSNLADSAPSKGGRFARFRKGA